MGHSGRTMRKPGSVLSLASTRGYAPKKPWMQEDGEIRTEQQLRDHVRNLKSQEILMPTPQELAQEIIDGKTTLEEMRFRADVDDALYRCARFEYLKMTKRRRQDEANAEDMEEDGFEREKLQDNIVSVPATQTKRKYSVPGSDEIPKGYFSVKAAAELADMKPATLSVYICQNLEFKKEHTLKNGRMVYVSPGGVELLKARGRRAFRSSPVKIVRPAFPVHEEVTATQVHVKEPEPITPAPNQTTLDELIERLEKQLAAAKLVKSLL